MNWLGVWPGSAEAYAFATLCVVIAGVLRWALGLVSDDVLPLPTFYPAVFFAALVGGAGPGTFAAVLGGIIAWYAFMPQHLGFPSLTVGQQLSLLTYLFACLLIVWGAEHYRRLMKRLEEAENFRKLTVDELAHRLKNKLATIQSIITLRLREHPQARDEIISSLGALRATDDLIMATQGKGADIGDILSAELAPYGVSRISMEGPDILLSPRLALTMALLVHELATNAAKYGALSSAAGKLSICWKLSDARLSLEWQESSGPPVSPPTHRGFGTRLFLQALEQFNGNVEATFASTGFICKLIVVLPDDMPSVVSDTSEKASKYLQQTN